jgi:uncharacterized membrane protein
MAPLLQVLLVVHVLCAMLWFGGAAFVPRRLRDVLGGEPGQARRSMLTLLRQSQALDIACVLAVLTGIAMAFVRPGGFAALAPRFHVALLLSLIWVALALLVVRPTMQRIADSMEGNSLEPSRRFARRVGKATGLEHALFVTVLVLMLWRL